MKSSDKSILPNMLLLLTILTATSGCVTGLAPVNSNSYCAIAKPIFYDFKNDTPKTVAQVEAHNSTWVCLCEKDCPASAPNTK